MIITAQEFGLVSALIEGLRMPVAAVIIERIRSQPTSRSVEVLDDLNEGVVRFGLTGGARTHDGLDRSVIALQVRKRIFCTRARYLGPKLYVTSGGNRRFIILPNRTRIYWYVRIMD